MPYEFIENLAFHELSKGDGGSLSHLDTNHDIDLLATVTGDVNPAHMYRTSVRTDMVRSIFTQWMWGAGLISAVLGTRLPDPGTTCLRQALRFRRPMCIGDTIIPTVIMRNHRPESDDTALDWACTNQHSEAVITGTAEVRAPAVILRRPHDPIALYLHWAPRLPAPQADPDCARRRLPAYCRHGGGTGHPGPRRGGCGAAHLAFCAMVALMARPGVQA